MTTLDDAAFLTWLKAEANYVGIRPLPGNRWAAVWPMLYTHAILVGRIGDRFGYDDRWCYSDLSKAVAALDAWDGAGEPQGWHRHPVSGRRRADGDAEMEIIAP